MLSVSVMSVAVASVSVPPPDDLPELLLVPHADTRPSRQSAAAPMARAEPRLSLRGEIRAIPRVSNLSQQVCQSALDGACPREPADGGTWQERRPTSVNSQQLVNNSFRAVCAADLRLTIRAPRTRRRQQAAATSWLARPQKCRAGRPRHSTRPGSGRGTAGASSTTELGR